jgi:CRP-like cAMP-binding protein
MLEFRNYLLHKYLVQDKDWDLIQDLFETTFLKKGEYQIQKGRICFRMGFIAEGVMRYTLLKDNDREVTCYFICENDFFGDPDSFISQKPSEMTLQAVTNCRLITFSLHQYKQLFKIFPRFSDITNDIGHKAMLNLLDQKTFLMDNDAASRYAYFIRRYPHLLQRVPLGYIASFLDITQQSLSRLRKQII